MTAVVGVVVTAQVTQACRLAAAAALQMQDVVVHDYNICIMMEWCRRCWVTYSDCG